MAAFPDGTMSFPTHEARPELDLVSILTPFLLIYIFQLTMPVVASSLVEEKAAKLRDIMRMVRPNPALLSFWSGCLMFSAAF